MASKRAKPEGGSAESIIQFSFGDRTYQIDPQRQKVYRRFVEIETAKALEIFSVWRSRNLNA